MNRIKFLSKITYAASLLLALALTSTGCSSDDGDSGGKMACKFTKTFNEPINGKSSGEICRERSGSTNNQEAKDECEKKFNGTFYNSCPKGFVLKCEEEKYTTFLYGDEFKGLNCKEFFDKK